MRIKKLYITGYKNLHNLTLDFEAGNGLTMLIGNNGSGKSNILEAISGIFHDAYKESSERKLTAQIVNTVLNTVLMMIKLM